MGIRSYLISQKTNGLKPRAERLTAKFCWNLKYKNAFEIYEAQNLKFKKFEISELFDMDMKVINYAVQHQREIKETIKHDLQIVYRNKIPERYQFLFNK